MNDWQKELTDIIGENSRKIRKTKGLTARGLAEKTEQLGFKVSRSGISELENKARRSVSVAEWLILARALEVAPVVLLMPDYPDGATQYLPGHHAMGYEVADWITGQRTTNTNPTKNNSAPLETPTQLAELLAKRNELEITQPGVMDYFPRLWQETDHQKIQEMLSELNKADQARTQRIDRIDRDITNLGHYANRARRDETLDERLLGPTTDTD